MLEYLAASVLGVFFGVFTGLFPGIHANTVVFISLPAYFRYQPSLMIYMSFIGALSVSHTFHDFLPSIFFGLAEAETALATLPGPRMAAKGKGLEAFSKTVSGGLFSVLGFLIVSPLLFLVLKPLYTFLSEYMFWILLFFLFFAVLRSDNSGFSALLVVLSGFLGFLTFDSNVNQAYALMPVFSGLFSAPAVLKGLSNDLEIPPQSQPSSLDPDAEGTLTGFLSGVTAGILPGIGSAISTSFFAPLIKDEKQFLTAMGAVNTSDIFISFVALILLDKSRSGASVAISYLSDFSYPQAMFLIGISVLAAGISAYTAFNVSKHFLNILRYFRLSRLFLLTSVVLVLTTIYLTGALGLLILFTSSCIGYAASLKDERRSCMAVLILPAMRFYTTGITV